VHHLLQVEIGNQAARDQPHREIGPAGAKHLQSFGHDFGTTDHFHRKIDAFAARELHDPLQPRFRRGIFVQVDRVIGAEPLTHAQHLPHGLK